jgi:hypothetical protein
MIAILVPDWFLPGLSATWPARSRNLASRNLPYINRTLEVQSILKGRKRIDKGFSRTGGVVVHPIQGVAG